MTQKRLIVLAAMAVFAIYGFEYLFLEPKSEGMKEKIQTTYYNLQKYEDIIKSSGTSGADIQTAADDIKNLEKRLLQESSEFLASAKVQREVSDLISKAGLNVLTTRPLNAVKTKNYASLPVYFEGIGNIKQISDFLKMLEESKSMYAVDKLNLNVQNMQNPKDLRFKIQISGLVKL